MTSGELCAFLPLSVNWAHFQNKRVREMDIHPTPPFDFECELPGVFFLGLSWVCERGLGMIGVFVCVWWGWGWGVHF